MHTDHTRDCLPIINPIDYTNTTGYNLPSIVYGEFKMLMKNILPLLFVHAVFCVHDAPAQDWSLTISGEVTHSLTLHGKEFISLPHSKIHIADTKGVTSEYEGVSLLYLLQKAGTPLGDSVEGKNLTWYVQAEATDGYKVIFALPEIDSSFTKNSILIADKKNGGSLDTSALPLMIVVPHEQRHGRWIRHLSDLRVLRSTQ